MVQVSVVVLVEAAEAAVLVLAEGEVTVSEADDKV